MQTTLDNVKQKIILHG